MSSINKDIVVLLPSEIVSLLNILSIDPKLSLSAIYALIFNKVNLVKGSSVLVVKLLQSNGNRYLIELYGRIISFAQKKHICCICTKHNSVSTEDMYVDLRRGSLCSTCI